MTYEVRQKLIKRAETVLRPSLAMLIECAFESERSERARAFLGLLMGRFYTCAMEGLPLSDEPYEVVQSLDIPYGGENSSPVINVGLLTGASKAEETVFHCTLPTSSKEFADYVVERTLAMDITRFAPMVLGVGRADHPDTARSMARSAMFRASEAHHTFDADTEKRVLTLLNSRGPGAGGFGGGHTALAAAVMAPQKPMMYTALCPGGYFTRFASDLYKRKEETL
jgi:tartrate dehydratase alpha subunit/fumarate hydratase class I-like protein